MSQITSLLRKYPWLIFSIIAFIVFLQFNWSYPINILDEAKNSEAAREMLETGRWFYPTFNERIRTDKPPLHYFFMALGYLVFGVGSFGARFFSAVFGALTFYVIVKQTARDLGSKTAIYSGLTFISSLLFAHEFHMAVPDPYLIFTVTWAIVSFYRFEKESSKVHLWMAYIAIGFGLLAKGPIAAVIVLLSAALYFTLTQRWSRLFAYKPFTGVFIALAIATPWYYMAHIATEGVFTEGFFLDHNLNRFSDQKEGHGGPFIVTPLLVIAGLLPFGVWLISALIKAFRLRESSNWLTLCFSVSIGVLVFFSFSSTKLPNYPMPAFGFMTVVLGFYFSELVSNQNSKALKGGLWVLTILGTVLTVGAYFGLATHKSLFLHKNLAFFILILPVSSLLIVLTLKVRSLHQSLIQTALSWIIFGSLLWGYLFGQISLESPVVKVSPYINQPSIQTLVNQRMDPAFPIQLKQTFKMVQKREILLTDTSVDYILTNTKNKEDIQWLDTHFEKVVEAPALFEDHTTRLYQPIK